MKEQGKNLGNQPEKEFRGMVINMIQNLGNRMEAWIKKIQEMFNKDPKELKNTQWWATQLKWKIHWKESMQNNWEEWISKLEEQMLEIITEEQNKEKKMRRNEDSLTDLWDITEHNNIQIIEVSEEEKRKGLRKYLKRLVKNLLNMRKEIATQVQEAQRLPYSRRQTQWESHWDTY